MSRSEDDALGDPPRPLAVQTGAAPAGHSAPSQHSSPLDQTLDAHRETLRTMFPIPPARPAGRRGKRVAGGLAMALLAMGLWWADPAYRTQQYATVVGEQRSVELADGSKVLLDTASTVRTSWHLRSRRVELLQGRVHFDVRPSTYRPFTVASGPARVQVVGTRFDVWLRHSRTEVAVHQGQVKVWRTGGHASGEAGAVHLQAGQQIHIATGSFSGDSAAPLHAQPFDTAAGAAWRDGRLVFQNTPLAEALAQIQRYRAAPIRLHADFGKEMNISGVFDSRNTDLLLDQLPTILPLWVTRHDNGIVDVDLP